MKCEFAVCLSVLLAVTFCAAVGAFLLYVPALEIVSTTTIVLGLGLMYALGLMTGARWRRMFVHRPIPAGKFRGNLSVVR